MMWNKPQQLNLISGTLFFISFLLVLYGTLHTVLHLPKFNLRAVQLSAVPRQVDVAQIVVVVRNELRGNFFTVDLEAAQRAFEKLPWVRSASVRRQFPWRLEVELEEHVALARWNGAELVNTYGEVFIAQSDRVMPEASGTHRPPLYGGSDRALPEFFGQPDSAAEVTQAYREFSRQLTPLEQQITQINLSPRHSWQLRLDSGLLLKLGREQTQERMQRFVAAYPSGVASAAQYLDLRYRNGFAVMYKEPV